MSAPVLQVAGISKSFGGLKAVSDFSLTLHDGDVQGLIGPNGAGKTTCFNLLTGVYRPDTGSVKIDGKDITGLRPFRIAAAGLARTFQNIRLFPDLSVIENVMLASHLRTRQVLAQTLFRTAFHRRDELDQHQRAMELLSIFALDTRAEDEARSLPYGDQRKLEIARALATNPRVLLLDEPAAGMNPQEKNDLRGLIRKVRERFAVTILLIEHDMNVVMNICERITVLDYGVTIAVGEPREIQKNPKVIEAYLGEAVGEEGQSPVANGQSGLGHGH